LQVILRLLSYGLVGAAAIAAYVLASGVDWHGSAIGHTVMEVSSGLLAIVVGSIAIIRYYARREAMFMYIGLGFLGAGAFDSYQAAASIEALSFVRASGVEAVFGWSWLASRQFLALFMMLGWLSWLREERHGSPERISDRLLMTFAGLFVGISLLVFGFVPLPQLYFPDLILPRVEELAPAAFFLMALIGYLFKGRWQYDVMEHWVIISLILGFVAQAVFMASSAQTHDAGFEAAHIAKALSYIVVLIGLIFSMELDSAARLHAVVDSIAEGIVTIDKKSVIQTTNPAARHIFGRLESEMVGHRLDELIDGEDSLEDIRQMMAGTSRKWRKIHHHVVEVEGIKLSGSTFPMELGVTRLDYAAGPLFVAAIRDITAQKEMDRVKSEFIANVSHELRTPLTVILGYLPLISRVEEMPGPDVIARLAGNMTQSGEHLLALVTDLLDISRIEAGRLVLDRVSLSTEETINSVADMLANTAESKGLKIVTEAESGIVHGDETRLKQILINLVTNAIKFTEEGEITVTAKINPRGVNFTVSDTGEGIPFEQLETVFDRFKQLDGSQTREQGGTGLGLAITRSLVELHGGSIYATSAEGHGTKFVFDIPDAR